MCVKFRGPCIIDEAIQAAKVFDSSLDQLLAGRVITDIPFANNRFSAKRAAFFSHFLRGLIFARIIDDDLPPCCCDLLRSGRTHSRGGTGNNGNGLL